jgi:hypothetical protein
LWVQVPAELVASFYQPLGSDALHLHLPWLEQEAAAGSRL